MRTIVVVSFGVGAYGLRRIRRLTFAHVKQPDQKASRVRQRGRTRRIPNSRRSVLVGRYHPLPRGWSEGRYVVRFRGARDGGGNRFRFGQPRSGAERGHRGGGYPHHTVYAAADEVSAAIAELFGAHGQEFQALSAQASAFHDRFVRA